MFLILDTETTDLENGRLVQLAYKNTATGDIVNEYFKPPVPISVGAMAVHHITNESVAGKSAFAGSSHQTALKNALVGNILVAHNAPFDVGILKNEGVEVSKFIDTLSIAKHLIESPQFGLQYLRYFLKLNVDGGPHNAMGDVTVLEALFDYLKALVKEKFSLTDDDGVLQKMLELTNTPTLIKDFKFGKHNGKTFEEVSKTDRSYLDWLCGSELKKPEGEQNKELVYTLKYWLK